MGDEHHSSPDDLQARLERIDRRLTALQEYLDARLAGLQQILENRSAGVAGDQVTGHRGGPADTA